MIIYNNEWLDNLRIHKAADKWFRKGTIAQWQLDEVKTQFVPGYKKTNLFIRMGLALFTLVATLGTIGLTMYVLKVYNETGFATVFLLAAAMSWVVLEVCVRERRYFRHGIDDMLLYVSLAYFITGLTILVYWLNDDISSNNVLFVSVLTLPVLILAAIRFADIIASLAAYFCLLLIVFILVEKTGEIGKAIMPFVILLVSFLTYRFISGIKKKEKVYYWNYCLDALKTASLVTLYAAGNYFVVREASAELFGLSLKPGEDIPLAIIFYALTFAIPVIYIVAGVRNKDKIFLRTGMVLAVLAVLTYRYYYHIISTEIALTASGALLIALSGYVIRKLKTPWRGITFKETEEGASAAEAEGLLITQTFGQQAIKTPESGGGRFGGGGASGNF